MGSGHTDAVGVKTHLRNEPRRAARALVDRHFQRFAIANQGLYAVDHTRLGSDPVLQQRLNLAHMQLVQEQPEGGIRFSCLETLVPSSSLSVLR